MKKNTFCYISGDTELGRTRVLSLINFSLVSVWYTVHTFFLCRTKSLRTPPNVFVVNLALSDLSFSLINGFPLTTIASFQKGWQWGNLGRSPSKVIPRKIHTDVGYLKCLLFTVHINCMESDVLLWIFITSQNKVFLRHFWNKQCERPAFILYIFFISPQRAFSCNLWRRAVSFVIPCMAVLVHFWVNISALFGQNRRGISCFVFLEVQ